MSNMYLFCGVVLLLYFVEYNNCASIVAESTTSELDLIDQLVFEHVINQANKPMWFELENPVNPFVGRVAELSELKLGHLDKKITIITGPRGIGKTELARKYAQSLKHDNYNIIWLDSTQVENLIASFKDLALRIGKTTENKAVTSIIREAFEFFRKRKSLFILDHARSNNVIIKHLNSLKTKDSHIVITSRDENWDESYKVIQLKPFSTEQSLEYLKTVLSTEIHMIVTDELAEQLATMLKHLPLALNEATQYIILKNTAMAHETYTVQDYIEHLKRKQTPVVTIVRPPTDSEIEQSIKETLQNEAERIGEQITDETKRTAKKISEEAARIEGQVRDFFSQWG